MNNMSISLSYTYKGVCIYAEYNRGCISTTTYDLIHIGRSLATKLNVTLSVIIIGSNINKTITQDYINIGVDNLYICDNTLLYEFQDNIYSDILLRMIQIICPEILIFSATSRSIPLASIIAAKLYTGMTSNCISLDIDIKTRNLQQFTEDMKTILTPYHRPQIVTLRAKIFNKIRVKCKANRIGKIVKLPIDVNNNIFNKIKAINFTKYKVDNIFKDLSTAEVIVSVGRGVRTYKIFQLIKEFVMIINGKLGASKGIVDLGWVPYSCQIGETGISVNPRLYIACGISGHKQHTIGINSSSTIVAINIDPNCYMMQIANFALQGDLGEIITEFIKQLKKHN
ncbi:MAG: electron transfer flavoprotein subunit alpha/FixB family protein [Endomicrobium sp.]|jgi:electron transfer flavoprotein alpha subunit|nr:electron transfer flavoprotein subunit alpha/FixB family protein [Endomicrobium sp.]